MQPAEPTIITANTLMRLLISAILGTMVIATTAIFLGIAIYNLSTTHNGSLTERGVLTQYYMFSNDDPHFDYGCPENDMDCDFPRGALLRMSGNDENEDTTGNDSGHTTTTSAEEETEKHYDESKGKRPQKQLVEGEIINTTGLDQKGCNCLPNFPKNVNVPTASPVPTKMSRKPKTTIAPITRKALPTGRAIKITSKQNATKATTKLTFFTRAVTEVTQTHVTTPSKESQSETLTSTRTTEIYFDESKYSVDMTRTPQIGPTKTTKNFSQRTTLKPSGFDIFQIVFPPFQVETTSTSNSAATSTNSNKND